MFIVQNVLIILSYYLFWPFYLGLWRNRYSTTTFRDGKRDQKKTVVEHELAIKALNRKHFWAPFAGIFLYTICYLIFILFNASLDTPFLQLNTFQYILYFIAGIFLLAPSTVILVSVLVLAFDVQLLLPLFNIYMKVFSFFG